jgi:signal transduction histidine kinase
LTSHFWQAGWFQIVLLIVCGTVVLICLQLAARLAVQSKAQGLMQLERARIARDIHDDLGAQLTQLVLLAEVARSELGASSEAGKQMDYLCAKARELSGAMDEVVWAVNSRRDTVRDFTSYVCKYAQLYLVATPIRCRLDVELALPPASFELPIRRNLLLAVKEALNNAARHSGANELVLRIARHKKRLTVVVEDNGCGFDSAKVNHDRNGLTNMVQRMAEIGGECFVTSAPGSGCRVEFIVPLMRRGRLARWLQSAFDRRASETSCAGEAKEMMITSATDSIPS